MTKLTFMPVTLKEQLLKKIESTENENLLQLLNIDFDYFAGSPDITEGLSKDEINDLQLMVNEPDDKDTISWDEYKQATAAWRKNSA